jgi:site-specific DNA recombinase
VQVVGRVRFQLMSDLVGTPDLTGVMRCGKPDCGHFMRATRILQSPKERRPGVFSYGCPARSDGGCGGISIFGPKTDEYIVAAVVAKIEQEAAVRHARAHPSPTPALAFRGGLDDDSGSDLTMAWRARPQLISSARYFARLPKLEPRRRPWPPNVTVGRRESMQRRPSP